MSFELTLFGGSNTSPLLPNTLVGWLGWFFMLALLAWGFFTWWEGWLSKDRQKLLILAVLAILVPFTSLFFVVRLPLAGALPPPELPAEPRGAALLILAAVPWVLAGGFLGVLPAVALGGLSGILVAAVETHNLFTPLTFALLALIFSANLRQRYRTFFYRLLRRPLFSAVIAILVYVPIYLSSATLALPGHLVARLDYAFSRLGMSVLAVGGELLIAAVIAEVVAYLYRPLWGKNAPLQPSPAETSLQVRFFMVTAPLVLGLLLALAYADWIVAGNAARQMIRDRLSSTAQIAADGIPFFLESGQNILTQIARDPLLMQSTGDKLTTELAVQLQNVPYFRQLYLFDAQGKPLGGYPENNFNLLYPSPEEQHGIQLALHGVAIQNYTLSPSKGDVSGQVAFIAAIPGANGSVMGVLLGRTDLASNPLTQPFINAMNALTDLGGQGMILDNSGRILYHSSSLLASTTYYGTIPNSASFYDEAGPDGTRQLVYFQPTTTQSWAVVFTVPAQRAQQLGLNLAVPLLLLIFFMMVFIIAYLRFGLRGITASLQTLAGESLRISEGQLDSPLPVEGADEVGRLRQAFEGMRVSLKSRLDDINRLLAVSQGVASSLKIEDAVRPILEAGLANGANAARVVLAAENDLDTLSRAPASFGLGPAAHVYARLDERILALVMQHDPLILGNLTRGKGLNLPTGIAHPSSLLAVSLRHENRFYGVLWVAYDMPRRFSDEEVRFLTMLAGEAALAAANSRLYATAEVGRQRLEAVLASTPDAILVTDHKNQLLLSNPAAAQLPGMNGSLERGKNISKIVSDPSWLRLLNEAGDEHSAAELSFQNGRTYYATVSAVSAAGQPVGKVCILRDITHYKELDTLKSDFVATVSHDLRSPLQIMRGYTTLLQMVGELNEQQKNYMRRIVSGVENMSRLVNSLLDLGRIEAGVGLKLESVSVIDMVERATSQLQLQAAQKNIQLDQEFPLGENPTIEVDRALLEQALYNLIENGIKYTPVGGQVKLKVQTRKSSVIFAVQDTGIGIAPLDQPRLFEKFYRGGQREAYQQRGTGLGLAIVKSVAERHAGRVWLESQLGKGSTFYIEIPLQQAGKTNKS